MFTDDFKELLQFIEIYIIFALFLLDLNYTASRHGTIFIIWWQADLKKSEKSLLPWGKYKTVSVKQKDLLPCVIWTFWCVSNISAAALSLPQPRRQEGFTTPSCWAHHWKQCVSKKSEKTRCAPSSLSSTHTADYQCCSYQGENSHSSCLFSTLPPLSPLSYIWV